MLADPLTAETETAAPQSLNSAAREKLKQFVARVERLEEEKTELMGQIKEVYAEAKSLGFDTKALRTVVRLRKQDAREREEAEMMLDLYLQAIGEL
jgi:uncharacterized protein (UPF0335 family)